jgi:plasmid stabilization system protein ParE
MASSKNRQFVFSPKALTGLEQTTISVARAAGARATDTYIKDIKNKFLYIAQYPERHGYYDKRLFPTLRKSVFHKLTVIFYTYTDDEVFIYLIADARSNWEREISQS